MNRDRLHLWQDRLARNDSQYENWYALMDERERLYQGSRYIFPLVNKYRPSNAKTPHVRNICATAAESALKAGTIIPVFRVLEGMLFATTWSAAASAVNAGDLVTLSADGMQVTATTTSGVAEVVSMDGTAVGDTVYVRFPA